MRSFFLTSAAVGAEQTEDLSPIDLKVEGPQRDLFLAAPKVAVDLSQLARLDDDVVTGHAGPPLE